MRPLLFILIFISHVAFATPLSDWVTVDDGLDTDNPENVSDDYVRLTLIEPNYQHGATIKTTIDEWLGPGMVIIIDQQSVNVMAPRSSTARVTFIAALLNLQVPIEPAE